ncbi:hypothetical protein [Niallia taxi]|uniref:hypothetical protein n=1 Tax=Niallia taxi TaxID=2499688 RepID=UPI00119E59C3|nr:hypothetical protein [Niallia taxi]MCT2345838.1 hypothetical protein [Niallia taxi]MDE5054663.1 hypothetical protein [Niallia taxi]MED3962638.1 hypothetical protein [Niallia taxi]WOD65833.1 hypothetical protein NQZ71_21820 [Niallia taxi]
MKVFEKTSGFYSNDNHANLPLGLAIILDGCRYTIFSVDEENDVITCVSRTHGFTYLEFEELEAFLEEGRAFLVID